MTFRWEIELEFSGGPRTCYRAASTARFDKPIGEHRPEPSKAGWCDQTVLGALTLFRYSAVTFNSHRIHYDDRYASAEEGYPGLVVHGPLTATLLAESARRRGSTGSAFSFRATAPLFAGLAFHLCGEPRAAST